MKKGIKQNCPKCGHAMWRDGFDRNRRQLWRCSRCRRRLTQPLAAIRKPERIGQHLRHIRQDKKITLKDVSDQLGKSISWLSRLESGERGVGVDELFDLAAVYQTRASMILGEFEKLSYPKQEDTAANWRGF